MGFSKNITGLEISPVCIRAVELTNNASKPKFVTAHTVQLPQGTIKDGSIEKPEIVTGAIKKLWREAGIKTKDVLLGVNNQYVIVRIANMPRSRPDQWEKTIRYQAQEFLPVSINSVELDYWVVEEENAENPNQMRVMLVAGGKKMINQHILVIENAGLRINDIDVSVLALTKILTSEQKILTCIILNLCKEGSSLLILSDGAPVLARNLNSQLSESLDIDIEKLTSDEMETLTGTIAREIISSANYYQTNYPKSNIGNIYLSGMFCDNDIFVQNMKEHLDAPLSVINPFSMLNGDADKMKTVKSPGVYGIVIGLAIRGLEG